MLRFGLFFAIGTWLFHQLSRLPDPAWLLIGIALILVAWRMPGRPISTALLLGLCWSHGYALLHRPADLPSAERSTRALADGQVVGLPRYRADITRFVLRVRALTIDGVEHRGDWRVRLSWRAPPPLVPGQRWRLPLRLRAVHGYASPGSWDYEGWLYHQGIRYTGYVSDDGDAVRLATGSCCAIDRVRAKISAAIARLDASAFGLGVIRALAVADRSGLTSESRSLFRNTGTSHLMAISGLHIGLVAGAAMLFSMALWRNVPTLCGRVPARVAGAYVGVAAAAVYALLAGMGLPTQRALIMLSVFALALVLRRRIAPLKVLAIALLCVLLWHPPSVVAAGLWLSFAAVLVILAIAVWQRGRGRLRQAIWIQCALGLGLWPLLSAFQLPVTPIAVGVNLFMVPLFGLLVVPWCLLGVALLWLYPPLGDTLLTWLAGLLDLAHPLLQASERLATSLPMGGGLDMPQLIAVACAVTLLLQPPGWPLRWLAIPLLGLVLLPRQPALGAGEFRFDLLDVGQGLSAVVSTREHCLVYDTGAAYPSGFSTAQAVVVPFLRSRHCTRIDRLILSHGDRDHAGGAEHLARALPIGETLSGEPARLSAVRACHFGQDWTWDGVRFEILHPVASETWSGNNASCVLRVSNIAGSVLLSGDIEAVVERHLGVRLASRLKSDVVVAPHHGSASSSSAALIAATQPRFVLYPAGWANRYGFPTTEVVRRWRDAGAIGLETARLGHIGFHFSSDGRIVGPMAHRLRHRRFWWHDAGSVDGDLAVSSGD